jgi:flagellar hook-associated protein 3 FlgL
MRISTNMMYDTGVSQMGTLQTNLLKTQGQMSTGRRMQTPSDDPIAASRALEVAQSDAINTQQVTNRNYAKTSLTQVSSILTSTTTLIQDVQSLAVSAANGAYSNSERASLAAEMDGRFADLLALANTADGTGGYLFAGYRSDTQPFSQTATGATYQGDQGQRLLQVGSSRQIAISASGSEVFEHNMTGNGTFSVAASAANTGTAVIQSNSVINAGAITHHNYDITFAVSGGATTYSVTDNSLVPPAAISTGVPFVSGEPIAFDGLQVNLTGVPADQDKVSVAPSLTQSIFTTLRDMITAIGKPVTDEAESAALSNSLATTGANLNSALDNVLSIQSTIGSNLKELDYLDSAGSDMTVQYAATLSQLQDLDYTKAISSLSQQQITLEAAQKAFKATTSMSLFSLL